MKKEEVSAVIDRIDEQYIREASAFAADDQAPSGAPAGPEKIHRRRLRVRVLAACAALVVLAGSAAAAFAAEEKEYKTAVAFFAENELSTEGLSRADVKAVYRDIVTQRFAFDKTEEVLRQTVTGVEILQRKLFPGELALLWNEYREKRRMNPSSPTLPKKGIEYAIKIESWHGKFEVGSSRNESSTLKCYQDGKMIWETVFMGIGITKAVNIAGRTAVLGSESYLGGQYTQPAYAWIAWLDEEGDCLWKRRLSHGFTREHVSAILLNDDGTLSVIGEGDIKGKNDRYLCVSRFDTNGNEIGYRTTEMGDLGIVVDAARLGEGYVVRTIEDNFISKRLFTVDQEVNILDVFSFEEEDREYAITDMAEFGGQVYFSAYVYPKPQTETVQARRREFDYVLTYAGEAYFGEDNRGEKPVDPDELLEVVRDKQTAVLLVCDPTDGTPKTFCSVKGASDGGKLTVNDDEELEWEVNSILSICYHPYMNSRTFDGISRTYRYTFDTEGNLISQTDTGEMPYYFI